MKTRKLQFHRLALEVDLDTGQYVSVTNVWEPQEWDMLFKYLLPSDRVLIAGGGEGLVAGGAALLCGVDNVAVYEANPALVDYIRKEVTVDGWALDVQHAAISTSTGDRSFFVSDNHLASSLHINKEAKKITVPTVDVNEEIAQKHLNVVHLDVEGSEVELLPHLRTEQLRGVYVEIHPWAVGKLESRKLLTDFMARTKLQAVEILWDSKDDYFSVWLEREK